jgi:serine/threonine protein kinase
LGSGAFGKVNMASHLLTKQLVAIKSISKAHLDDDIARKNKVKQEMIILK